VVTVAVDAWCLSGGAAYRGVGTYARQIIGGLARTPGLDLVVLAERSTELPDGARRVPLWRLPEHRWSQIEHEMLLPFDLRRGGGDVTFEPTPDPPRRTPGPLVQTLHDVIPLVDDAGLTGHQGRWQRYIPRYQRADAVIAVSRYTADEGIRILHLDPKRVHVCLNGVDRSVFHPGIGDDGGRPYVVMVNEYERRKGFDAAFAAIGAIADAGLPHSLRVAGRIRAWAREEVAALQAAAPRPERVELLGFVDDLAALYRGAAAAIVTSRYEGFGLPALEAMACGIPVIAWSNTGTAEVVGDGGVLVPDGDLPALVAAMTKVLGDPTLAAELRQRAVQRADQFSWERSVAEHAEIMRSVAI
jgi:glycosyltransferase involved in cell wall biosynthesis